MPIIDINLEGDGAFADIPGLLFHENLRLKIARLPNGTSSGKSAVAIGFQHGDQYIVVQTTLALLKGAVRAMEIRDEMEGRPT